MIGSWMISRSGGPALFVEQIVSDRIVVCSWMDPMGQHKTGRFDLDSLKPINERAGEPVHLALVSRQDSSMLEIWRRLKTKLRAATVGEVPTR